MASGKDWQHKRTFPSGLVLVHERTPSSSAVAYHLWVRSGSADEMRGEEGAAHFLEHMLFKGTETLEGTELNDEVEDLGGNLNAYTTYDYTAYHMIISGRYWKRGLELLLDLVFHPRLDAEDLEVERQVILEEIHEGEDSLDNTFSEHFFSELYSGDGYGRPIIGLPDQVKSISHLSLRSFYGRTYAPGNMVLAVAGNIDPRLIEETVQEFEPPVSSTNVSRGAILPAEPSDRPPVHSILAKGKEERILEIAFPIPGGAHADLPVLDLLSIVLGEGATSRLYREIRVKKQLARDVGSSMFAPFRAGQLFLRALPYRGATFELVEEMAHQVRRIQQDGVPGRELNRAKLELDKELAFTDETVDGRARTLAYYETMFHSLEAEQRYRDRIFAVSEREIAEAARKYLGLDRAAIGILVPASETPPNADEIRKAIDAGVRRKGIVRSNESSEAVERWTLPGGTRVVLRTVPGVRISSVYAAAVGGLWGETSSNNGISNLIASTLDRGTERRSDERVAEESMDLQAELTGVTGISFVGLKMDLVSGNLLPALDLFSDVLIRPQFDDAIVEQERNAILRELETQADYFDSTGFNLFRETLFAGHPYSMNALGRKETLLTLSGEDLGRHHRWSLRPETTVVGIVADGNSKELREELDRATEGWECEPPTSMPNPTLPPLGKVREVRRPIQGENAYLYYGFRVPSHTSKDRYALDVLSGLFASSGGGRLYIRLREELGLVYSVDAQVSHGLGAGAFTISLSTSPSQADLAFEEVRSQIEGLTKEAPTEEELKRVKNYIAGSYEIELQRSGAQAGRLCLGELFGVDRHLDEYVKRIFAVSEEEVVEVCRRLLSPDVAVSVLLSPSVH